MPDNNDQGWPEEDAFIEVPPDVPADAIQDWIVNHINNPYPAEFTPFAAMTNVTPPNPPEFTQPAYPDPPPGLTALHELDPPEGWAWTDAATHGSSARDLGIEGMPRWVTEEVYVAALRTLGRFLAENTLRMIRLNRMRVGSESSQVYGNNLIRVFDLSNHRYDHQIDYTYNGAPTCNECGYVNPPGTINCPECSAPHRTCQECLGGGMDIRGGYCSLCGSECGACGTVYQSREVCECQWIYCTSCDDRVPPDNGRDYEGEFECFACLDRRCPNCGNTDVHQDDFEFVDRLEMYCCTDCNGRPQPVSPGEPLSFADTEDHDELDDELDALEPIPGRENIRRSGVEIEGAGRGRLVAQALYSAGYAQYNEVLGYHGSRGTGESGYYAVENDSSVDWELVSPVVMLNDPESVKKLNGVLDIVRAQIREGQVGFDMRCGLHIHVEARPCSVIGAYNLASVWNHLEDTIFRLGAAKWSRHRATNGGSTYTTPLPKSFNNVREFGILIGDNPDRYNALSFTNFFGRLFSNCRCGAVRYDSWENCTCDLGKFTFEFRVFNTTANKKKMHAYLALSQALVAFATNCKEALDRSELPTLEFNKLALKDMKNPQRFRVDSLEAWVASTQARLAFIFTQLPLTEGEKESLLYCVRNSDCAAVGDEFIETLSTSIPEVIS